MSSEKSIASARASVMIYDDVNKKWTPSGTSSGLSKVHVFQHQVNNTFRVVGRKLQNQEVVINCVILKSLKYNQATATFHQWRDNKQVYGLNFSSKEDADAFAHAMLYAVEVLTSAPRPAIQQFPSPPVYPQTNGQYEEDMGYRPNVPMQQIQQGPVPNQTNLVYAEHNMTLNNHLPQQMNHLPPQDMPQVRTMTREDVAVLQERRMSQQSQMSSPSAVSPPGAGPTPPGHHRTSSAPPAPQPPPLSVPPAPPAPPPAPNCPPPPPLPNGGASTLPRSSSIDLNNGPPAAPPMMDMGSLAAQLQSARLKRASKQSAENSGSSTTSSSSGGGYSTLGRGGNTGMASMMDEMAKTLARRRAAVEKKDPEPNSNTQDECNSVERRAGSVGSVSWNNNKSSNSNTPATNGWESPKTSRKNLAASTEDVARVNGEVNGTGGSYITPADLDNVKQEILREVRRELGKIKTEIVDAIKQELSRR